MIGAEWASELRWTGLHSRSMLTWVGVQQSKQCCSMLIKNGFECFPHYRKTGPKGSAGRFLGPGGVEILISWDMNENELMIEANAIHNNCRRLLILPDGQQTEFFFRKGGL